MKKPLGRDEGPPRGTTLLRRQAGALKSALYPRAWGRLHGAYRAFTVRLGREFLRRATPTVLSRDRRPCLARRRILISVSAIHSHVIAQYTNRVEA